MPTLGGSAVTVLRPPKFPSVTVSNLPTVMVEEADGITLPHALSATWTFNHTLGRVPDVAISIGGEEVDADIWASTTQVIVTFPAPYAGLVILH